MTTRKTYENGRMNRSDILEFTPAEIAIQNALVAVEQVGSHPDLTNIVTKLDSALTDLQDYIERQNDIQQH